MSASCLQSIPPFAEVNHPNGQPQHSKRPFSGKVLAGVIKDSLWRDFCRGVSLRSLAKMYQLRVAALEEALRERAQTLEATVRTQARLGMATARRSTGTLGAWAVIGFSALMGAQALPQVPAGPVPVLRARTGRRRGNSDAYEPPAFRLFDGDPFSGRAA